MTRQPDAPAAAPGAWVVPLALAAVAVAVRFTLVLAAPDALPPATGDLLDRYQPIAASLAAGEGFAQDGAPTAEAPPLYPLLLAAIGATTRADLTAVRLLLSVGDGLLVALVVLLGRRLAGPGAAALAGLATALSPYFLYSTSVGGNDGLFALLNTAFLLALAAAVERPAIRRFAAAGALLGIATLCRAPSLFLPLAIVPAAVLALPRPRRRVLPCVVAFLAAFAAVLAPWTIRNAVRFHALVPVQTLGGLHLWLASGAPATNLRRLEAGPVGTDSELYGRAFENIASRPGRYLSHTLRRAGRLWYATHSGLHEGALLRANLVLLGLAGLGVALLRDRALALAPPLAFVVYYVALHSLTIALLRYMLPVIPLLTILAAVPVVRLREGLLRAHGGTP